MSIDPLVPADGSLTDALQAALADPGLVQVTEYNVATGVERVLDAYDARQAIADLAFVDSAARTEGFGSIGGLLPNLTPQGETEVVEPTNVFGPEGRVRINPTTGFPWAANGQITAAYSTTDWGWSSGSMIGPYHLLTAAHCVRKPTNEGGGFASSLKVALGQNGEHWGDYDSTTAIQSNNRFFGEANAVLYRAYDWSNTNFDYDIALVTLDRRIGNFTGHYGYGFDNDNDRFQNVSMNRTGYPGDLNTPPGGPTFDTHYQYFAYDPVTQVTTHQLRSNILDMNQGDSGGPLWEYIPAQESHTIYGVNSHESATINSWTRITSDKFNFLRDSIIEDNSTRAPTDRPDLVDYDAWFNANFAFFSTSNVQAGQSWSVTSYPRNNGTAATGSFNVSFYASTNDTISTGDFLLGSTTVSSVNPFTFGTATFSGAFPSSVPPGTYRVGWIIDSGSSQTEFLEGNNTGLIAGAQLTVAAASDRFEPNDSFAAATNLGTLGDRTENGLSIHAANNDDYYRLTAEASGNMTVGLSFLHSAGDVDLFVYNAGQTQIGSSTSTSNSESVTVGVTAGQTYFIKVIGFSGATNPDYDLTIDAPNDITPPTVVSTTPADGSTVSNGPTEILVNFSEPMRQLANDLLPGDLTLGGVGRGSITVATANWVDGDTARFTFTGTWATGEVTVQMTGTFPRDLAGNSLSPYTTGDFTIDPADPDDQISEAIAFPVGSPLNGSISVGTDVDMYSFVVAANQTRTFDIDRPVGTLDSYIRLFNASGTPLAANDDAVGPAPENSSLESFLQFTFTTAGTYYLGVSGLSNTAYNPLTGSGDVSGSSGEYTLTILGDTVAPFVTTTTPADGSTVGSGPTEILVNFSEPMNQAPGNLIPSDLTLGGPGLGTITVATATWVDNDTARFTFNGAFANTGMVTVQLTSGFPRDLSGNALVPYTTGDFTISSDITPPTVVSTSPADGSTVSNGPSEILVNFSEPMRQLANDLIPADLTLGGPGLGSITVATANWVDSDTARFTFSGTWGTGMVTVQLPGPFPRDLTGNALAPYTTGDFTIGTPGTNRIFTSPGGGQPQTRTFDASGEMLAGFQPYPGFLGEVRVAAGDVNGDGKVDILTAVGSALGVGPHVKVFNGTDGAELYSFYAYGFGFNGGVFIGAGDVNGDGRDDIITGADAGAGPHVKVFSGLNGSELFSFYAYGQGFNGGVRVAGGDVNGDGRDDIITGAGPGAGPHVKVFSGLNGSELASYYAYGQSFGGGVYVASGDVNNDNRDDVITGAGPSAGPHVKVFSGANFSELFSFYAFGQSFNGGVRVGAGDLNSDGRADIIAGAGPGAGPHVRAFSGLNLTELASFYAYPSTFSGGVYVAGIPEGASALSADSLSELAAGSLAIDQLQRIQAAAIDRFAAAGLDSSGLDLLRSVRVRVADLSGDRLGLARSGSVLFDTDAAGHGWFVDLTPEADEEFPGAQGVDLLSAMMHELAYVLEHESPAFDELLFDELGAGVRRLPQLIDAALAGW